MRGTVLGNESQPEAMQRVHSVPSSNTNISAHLCRTRPSQLFLCRLQSFQPPRLLKVIRKYPCSASGRVGWSSSRGRIGRLQPCKALAITLASPKLLFYFKVTEERKKKWFPMGFVLPPDARSSSSERVTGRFTAPVQRQRFPCPLPIRSCSSSVLLRFFGLIFSSFLLSSCFRTKSDV